MAVMLSLCGQDRQGPGADIGNAGGPLTRLPGSPGLGTAGEGAAQGCADAAGHRQGRSRWQWRSGLGKLPPPLP